MYIFLNTRITKIPLPDATGRRQILQLFLKNRPVGTDVNVNLIADNPAADGFSGADLKNLVQEAALSAIREESLVIVNTAISFFLHLHFFSLLDFALGFYFGLFTLLDNEPFYSSVTETRS